MSRQQRFGLVALAVAVAVAAFVIARPGDDGDPPAENTATVQTVIGSDAAPETGPAEPVEPPVTRIRVEGGQPVGGVETISVRTADIVRMTVTSDAPQEIHVHGYDTIENVGPDSPARFRFEADIEGVFEVELEGAHTQIAELRVEP